MRIQWIYIVAVIINILSISLSILQNGVLSYFNLLLLFNLCAIIMIRFKYNSFLVKQLKSLGVEYGGNNLEDRLNTKLISNHRFAEDAQVAFSQINQIGQVEFLDALQTLQNETLRDSLLNTHNKIINLREKEQENNWITQGVASISEIKHKDNNISNYAFLAISTIVKYIGANQGAFFILKEEANENYFDLAASYAYGKKKHISLKINPGEGLIGQVYYEKEMIYLTDVPPNYIKITSGLGEALPRCICIIPLISEGIIHGAIEIASFRILEPFEIEYLKKISETIGYNLSAIHGQHKTETLLMESQKMAQEVRTQEEELRQNMQELSATQEQMRSKQAEIDAVLSTLSTVELDLEGKLVNANEVFLGITGYQLSDVSGKLYKSLIPQHGNDPIQYEMMWSSILSGRSFSGEFRVVNKSGKEMWMVGNFTPILNDAGVPCKVMVISLFTTQDKDKLIELQEMVTAIKSCFPMAEINQDMGFKSANDLFLNTLGIKRIELRNYTPKDVIINGSFKSIEHCLITDSHKPNILDLEIKNKTGESKKYNSTLIKVNSKDQQKKGILILHESQTYGNPNDN